MITQITHPKMLKKYDVGRSLSIWFYQKHCQYQLGNFPFCIIFHPLVWVLIQMSSWIRLVKLEHLTYTVRRNTVLPLPILHPIPYVTTPKAALSLARLSAAAVSSSETRLSPSLPLLVIFFSLVRNILWQSVTSCSTLPPFSLCISPLLHRTFLIMPVWNWSQSNYSAGWPRQFRDNNNQH